MAVLSANNLTLADWAKRTDPDGTIADVANILSQTNEILQDCVFVEANGPTYHRVSITTGLPAVYWRALNQGIPTSKATTAQVDEGFGILEARSEVDIDLAMLKGQTAMLRLQEAQHFLEGMNQEMGQTLFYGNPALDPEEFLGFTARYSQFSAGNGQNVINGGGDAAATNTSIWLIGWSPKTVYCIFPEGSAAGLQRRDLGEQTSFDTGSGTGTRMQVLAEIFQWKNGLVVKDWRYAVRISTIKVADFALLDGTQVPTAFTHIIHKMAAAVARIPNLSACRPAFYMNRTVFSGLQRLGLEKSQNVLNVSGALTQFGQSATAMMTFMGIPCRLCDQILNTEQKPAA